MIQPPSLQLRDITLSSNDAGNLSFAATGDVTIDDTPIDHLPPFRLGVGQAVAVPQAIADAFAEHDVHVEEADFGLWLRTVNDEVDEPIWYGSFTTKGIDLFGVHVLQADALAFADSDGSLPITELQLRVALQVRGMEVQRALVVVAGKAEGDLYLGPVQVNGLDARFGLHIDIANMASLSTILDEPAAILDAAFKGRFVCEVEGKGITIVDPGLLSIDDAAMQFAIAVSSPAGERDLKLGDVAFGLQAAELEIVDTVMSDLDLACGYEAETSRVFMRGSAEVRLPQLFGSVLDPDRHSAGTAIRGAVDFEHTSAGTKLDLALDHLDLDPAINFLELSARDLRLRFGHDGNQAWQLKLSGTACQSWSRIARRMAEHGIARLPAGDDLPDLQGTLDFGLASTGSSFEYRLDLIEPDTGCQEGVVPIPFAGPLGPLPVELVDTSLIVKLTIDNNANYDWSFSGGGMLSTTGWLHDLMSIEGLTFGVEASGESGEVPELLFKIGHGIPSLKLPPLFANSSDIEIFRPETLAVRVGETLAIDGTATIPVDDLAESALDLVAELGLPQEWGDLLEPISDLLAGMEASLGVRVPIAGDGPATLRLSLEPTAAPTFRLMEVIGRIIANGQPAGDIDESTQIAAGEDHEFFEVRPGKIDFVASFADAFSLSLSLSFECKVFGETFDLTTLLRLVDGEPELLLMAGLSDPIRLSIPGIESEDVLGAVDVARLVEDYNLEDHFRNPPFPEFYNLFPYASSARDVTEAIQELERRFHDLFASPGVDTSLIFEIRNFGLRVRLDQAPSISGTVRLVQLPGFLDAIMPENGFDFGLGCSTQRIFISVKGPAADEPGGLETHTTDPLFSVPLGRTDTGQDRWVHLYFGRFELEYSWVTQAFGFVLDAAVVPQPADLFDFNLAGSGVYIPAQKTFVKLSKMLSTGHIPIIIPEWAISYKREGIGTEVVETAADEMGWQYYLGNPLDTDERLATLYFRETRFSPSYYMMQPGLTMDGGFIVGSHRPRDYRYDTPALPPPARYDEMFEAFVQPSDKLRAHVEINNWQLVFIPGSLGLMLNPLTVLAPGSPMPPFWIWPPWMLMGDVFADRISFSVNVPHVLFFGLAFTRPLPTLSLQGMMELAALAMTGFAETIPHTSELRQVYYATLDTSAELPLLQSLTGQTPKIAVSLEANIVDVVNGMIQLAQTVQDTIQDGQDLVGRLQADPSHLVRMVPAQARRFEIGVSHDLLHFELEGSLYVLTPEEVEEELVLYHQNKRSRRGLAASNPHGAHGNRIRGSAASGSAPLTVDFAIADTSETILDYVWDFGDGGTSTDAAPTHTFTDPGRYTVTLRTNAKQPDGEKHETVSSIGIVATGQAVNNQPLQLVETVAKPFRYIANPLDYFDPAEQPFQDYLSETTKQVVRQREQDYGALETLSNGREAAIVQFVNHVWARIIETQVGDKNGRQNILLQYDLIRVAEPLENIIGPLFSSSPSPPARPARQETIRIKQAPPRILHAIRAQFVRLVRDELTKPYTIIVGLDRSPHELAADIVADTVLDQPAGLLIQPTVVSPTVGVDVEIPGDTPGGNGGDGPFVSISISANPSIGAAPLTVHFVANVLGGVATGYAWSFGDGQTSAESSPSHTFTNTGSYAVSLRVTLSDGQERDAAPFAITVSPAPLIIKLTANPDTGTAPLAVQFVGQYGLNIMQVSWDFGDGSTGSGLHPRHSYTSPGTYTATATATNVRGVNHTASVTVVVEPAAPLIHGIVADPTSGLAPLAVQFSVQTDSNATITGYAWAFGDGSESQDASPAHIYEEQGSYNATVTVAASDGRSESRSIVIVANKPVSIVTIVNSSDRSASYSAHLPETIVAGIAARIEDCFAPWIEQVEEGGVHTSQQAAVLRLALADCIAATIVRRYRVITADLKDTRVLDISERETGRKLADALETTPIYVDGTRELTLYDGRKTRALLAEHVAVDREAGPGIDAVPEVGYEIRCRPEFVQAGETPTLATVPTSAPIYMVVSQAGQYHLLVQGKDHIPDETVVLPDWVTDGILPSPRATDLIRARLQVEQVIVERRLTDTERAYANHAFVEEDERLYQQSIFARPEYAIRKKGGAHGPLSIADLLVNRSGYVVPAAPLWVSGLKLKLLESIEIGLAGLLAAPNNIFLNGYHELDLEWGATKLVLKGEFHLISGDMWEEALEGNREFQANTLHFNGSAELRFDDETVFKGQASGTIGIPEEDQWPVVDLTVRFEYRDSWTLDFNNTELIKLTMDASFDTDVEFDPNEDPQFTLEANGDLGLSLQYAMPAMKEVVITPATTVCTWVPIWPVPGHAPYYRNECVTLPAITAQVPDLTNLMWETVNAGADFSLSIESSDAGNSLLIKLHVKFEHNGSHEREIVLSDLLN